jgi:predicted DNA-binding WGR domain protein
MKLINQVRLEFREGTSDKVYEVDLCEVGPGQYVVNFRYGRRGTALRDGSKTPAPVSQAQAQRIFDALIAEKRGKGYWDAATPARPQTALPTTQRTPAPPAPTPTPTVAGECDLELEWAQAAATPCPLCGAARRAFRVKKAGPNQGKLFYKCPDQECGSFEWVPLPVVAPTSPPSAPQMAPQAGGAREQGVLARLSRGFSPTPAAPSGSGRTRKPWRLPRAIWRAGQLNLRQAEPLLLALLEQTRQRKAGRKRNEFNSSDTRDLLGARSLPYQAFATRYAWTRWPASYTPPEDMILYAITWSLGRCGSAACVGALRSLRTETWEPIRRIATSALLMVLQGPARAALVDELTARLPEPLRRLSRTGPAVDFQAALGEYLGGKEAQVAEVLDLLYQIDNEHVRPALLRVLRTAPLRSAYFQPMRHLFKLAELGQDVEVFGILAHRFELGQNEPGHFQALVRTTAYHGGKLTQQDARISTFGRWTRKYLRLRVWRALRKLGEVGDPDYVRMAAGVLLPFTDADADELAVPAHRAVVPCRYWAYNQILYRNSPRYLFHNSSARVLCRRAITTADAGVREEAFGDLWQAQPAALLELIGGSRCLPVHRFAVRVLRACPDFCRGLDVPALVRLLDAPYEVTQALGLELAVERYDPAAPDHALVLALANCGLPRARAQAREWIDWQPGHFAQDLAFLASLAASPQVATRAYARDLLRQTTFALQTAEALIARVVALLRSCTAEEGERARDVARTLQYAFAASLRTVGVAVILDLLAHPLPEVRQFAGELLLEHATFAHNPPEDVLVRLFQDPDAAVRAVGVRLFGQLPDATLTQSLDLLVTLARHEMPDFRANIRPVVRRLADADPAFGHRIAQRLAEALLVPRAPEGVPSHTVRVLREDLAGHLGRIPKALIWKLLQARSTPAQEVGGILLAANVKPDDLSLAEIVRLASHDILAVREAAWQMCRVSLPRLEADMDTASRLVDAKWEDSRQFAFGLLRDAFHREELSPAILVSLCDSVRPDVQQFGREMITRLFAEQDGPEYAVRLSEHPSASMQMFAANFLERYAGTNAERLRELTFYFLSVLSRVNQGRIARQRVFAFLDKAARASQENAAVVAEVLGRQSATAAVGDRARAIEILTNIHAMYPELGMPLRVLPVEVRRGV